MDRSPAVGKSSTVFVKWEEVFLRNHRGRREVRYYLKRRDGASDLAVFGKEKKIGHDRKTSSSSSYRYRYVIRDKSIFMLSKLSSSKLRSRREVIDWLSSVVSVSDGSFTRPPQPMNHSPGAGDTLRSNLEKLEDVDLHKASRHATSFLWVGSSWTCRRKRRHYEAYSRNGVRISVHDFVYVLAEENKRLVAYLDDMYEDSRGNKMAVVRWFHKVDEVDLDLPPSYNDREIFFSLCLQDLSIECIDGLATVLSPHHYDKCLKADPHANLDPFVCRNLFDNEDVKPFDITQVNGYWKQKILRFMSSTTSNPCRKLSSSDTDAIEIRPRKRLRRLIDRDMYAEVGPCDIGFTSENGKSAEGSGSWYTIGSQIEVLSQDSGIRGIWFRAVVIKKHKDKLKVRYQDIKDADDESVNLEEWILSSRIAAPDQLGIRHCGRTTVRPTRSSNKLNVLLIEVGSIVDAWLHDGWWEGIVIHKESDDRIHIYFPGENQRSSLGFKDLRYSEEWLEDRWKQMKGRPDLLGSIPSATKTNSELTETIHPKELSSGHVDNSLANRDFEGFDHRSKEDFRACLKWNWSMKKRLKRNANIQVVERRKHDRCSILSLLKVDHDKCKLCDSSIFCRSAALPLVMSR